MNATKQAETQGLTEEPTDWQPLPDPPVTQEAG